MIKIHRTEAKIMGKNNELVAVTISVRIVFPFQKINISTWAHSTIVD
jgi:hypothetical protein